MQSHPLSFSLFRSSRLFRASLLGLWAVAVAGGLWTLWAHAFTPGASAARGASPVRTDEVLSEPGRVNLVMVVHPLCPCTRASLSELEAILAKSPTELAATILYTRPNTSDDIQIIERLKERCRAIPGAKLVEDSDGRQSARLQARTSGQTFVYDRDGTLRFEGGLTASRGHRGSSAAAAAIAAIVRRQPTPSSSSPVFGCSLN